MAHACNPSIQEVDEFEASLGYIGSSRAAWARPCPQNKQTTTEHYPINISAKAILILSAFELYNIKNDIILYMGWDLVFFRHYLTTIHPCSYVHLVLNHFLTVHFLFNEYVDFFPVFAVIMSTPLNILKCFYKVFLGTYLGMEYLIL
jgi:hypothetical protein